ncbi:MAG: UvrB/UvrC motif-containing protein [Clostridia bacterium]|nr:UvrB/UvrC motif-containing protein [Clostridia bacterium]
MLCEKCGKRNASVMYTQIINGKKSSLNLCSQCAQGESLFDNFGSLLSFGTKTEQSLTQCPVCGMTLSEFSRKGRMGCGSCYETFRRQAKVMLKKIHGTSVHNTAGEKPVQKQPVEEAPKKEKSELDLLKEQLQSAIESENYEEAAVLRDKIRSKEGK